MQWLVALPRCAWAVRAIALQGRGRERQRQRRRGGSVGGWANQEGQRQRVKGADQLLPPCCLSAWAARARRWQGRRGRQRGLVGRGQTGTLQGLLDLPSSAWAMRTRRRQGRRVQTGSYQQLLDLPSCAWTTRARQRQNRMGQTSSCHQLLDLPSSARARQRQGRRGQTGLQPTAGPFA